VRIWVSAKADYAVRAVAELGAADGRLVKARTIALSQHIPVRFLLTILRSLVVAGIVESHRGMDGGFRLARPATEVSLGDVLRAVVDPPPEASGSDPSSLEGIVGRLRSDAWRSLDEVRVAELVPGRVALLDVSSYRSAPSESR